MKPVTVVPKVLDAASRLFFLQGYNLTGVQQILDESGVARSSMFSHFPTKEDILIAYLKELHVKWFAGLESFAAGVTDPAKRLYALFDYRIARQQETDFRGCAWTKISAEVPHGNAQVFALVAKFKHDLKAYIASLVKELNRPADKALNDRQLTENIFLLMEGSQVMACVDKNAEDLKSAKTLIKQLL